MPQLSIIIVSYNCRALLAQCIQSISARVTRLSVETIVVDNASSDDVAEMLSVEFPEVLLIANNQNLGFSVANNIGIRRASGTYLLLLNPDTVIPADYTLDRLVDFMEGNPQVGAAGGNLIDPYGNKQVSAGYAPAPCTLFAFSFFLSKMTANRIKGLSLLPVKEKSVAVVQVDWLCAACMVVRREVLATVGYLNESYFLYGEDIEWGCRISGAGWQVCHLPSVLIVHIERGTQKQDKGVSCAWVDGMARVYMELAPDRSWWFFKYCLCAGLGLRVILYGVFALLTRKQWPITRTMEMYTWMRYLIRLNHVDYQHVDDSL